MDTVLVDMRAGWPGRMVCSGDPRAAEGLRQRDGRAAAGVLARDDDYVTAGQPTCDYRAQLPAIQDAEQRHRVDG